MVLRHYKQFTVRALKRNVTGWKNSDGAHWGWFVFMPCYVGPHGEGSQARAWRAHLLTHLVVDPGSHGASSHTAGSQTLGGRQQDIQCHSVGQGGLRNLPTPSRRKQGSHM